MFSVYNVLKITVRDDAMSGKKNGKTAVKEKTRARNNSAVKSPLKKISSATIAFVSGRMGSIFISTVAGGVEDRLKEIGGAKGTLAFHSPRNTTAEASSHEITRIIKHKNADAMIILSFTPDPKLLESIIKSKIPAVFIERQFKGIHSVKVDNFNGGYMAGEYLIKSGYKKPGIIIDAQTKDTGSAVYERFMGFSEVMKKSGIEIKKENMTKVDFHTIECGRHAMDSMAKRMGKVDSIFSVAGDMAAIGFMIEAKSHGIKIPRDLALMGFDDVAMAAGMEPALTTVRQPIAGMGKKAVDIIAECFSGGLKEPKNMVIDPELIIRETV